MPKNLSNAQDPSRHIPKSAMSQKPDSSLPLTVALMTFNRSAYLKEAIGGILAQTWQDFELLILDNASTDDTPEVVLGIRDERIRYVRNPPGFTAYFNGTSAIQIARGKRIIITHDDDVMHPTLLAKQMDMMEAHPGMTAVWTNTSVIDQAGNTIQAFSTPQGNDRIYGIGEFIARFPQENLLPLPSTLMFERARYPKKLIGQCYYDRQRGRTQPRTHGGDDILIPAIMNTFGPIAYLNEPLLKYRLHGIQDGNRTHLSLGVLNTYRTLRRLAGKLPDRQKTLALIESHIARFTTQHEVIHTTTRLSGKTRTKLRRLLDSTLSSPLHDSATTIPLLPLRIFLAQHGENITGVFSALAQPGPEHPTAMHALFRWAKLRQVQKNLFAPLPKQTNIVILGSALVSALLINEAREYNLNVLACIDSNITRQDQTMLGTPIRPPEWLASQGKAVDYVILSSERDQDAYLHEFIHSLNKDVKTLSWKDLALDQECCPHQPPRPVSN